MRTEEEKEVRPNLDRVTSSFGFIHLLGRGDAAGPIGGWPIVLIHHEHWLDFPPNLGDVAKSRNLYTNHFRYCSCPMASRAPRAGAVEFLMKPFQKGEFLATIPQALDRDRAQAGVQGEVTVLQS